MGGTDEYFSVIALFILFRETVEASIIVSVLLQFLSRSFPVLKKQVWWGVAFGLLVSVIFGIVFSILFYVAKENVFSGQDKNIFKGSIAWFAGVLITVLAFAMLRYKGWEDKIKRKLEAMAQKELDKSQNQIEEAALPPPTWHGRMVWRTKKTARTMCAPVGRAMAKCWVATSIPIERGVERCWNAGERATRATGRVLTCGKCCAVDADADKNKSELVDNAEVAVEAKHGWGIFMLVFSTVLREGVESVIFLAGVGNAQPSSLPLPGLVGFVCGLAAGIFCYYTGKQVKDLKWFMIIMSIILFFIAGGQFLLGVDFLYQGSMFGYCSPYQNERPWYMQPEWDLSECCGDADPPPNGKESKPQYKFFALVRAIFGYQDKPTIIEIVTYSVYWALVLVAAAFKYWKGSLFDADFKHTNEMKKAAREEARQRAAMEQAFTSSGQLPDDATLVEAKKLALTSASTQDLRSIDNESNSRQSSDASPVAAAGAQPGAQPAQPLQDRPTQQPAQQHMQQ